MLCRLRVPASLLRSCQRFESESFANRKKAYLNDKVTVGLAVSVGTGSLTLASLPPMGPMVDPEEILQKLTSLDHLLSKYIGKRGGHGKGKGCEGANSEPIYIPLPLGTLIMRDKTVLHDMLKHREEFLAVRGGKGGKGNVTAKDETRECHDDLCTPEPGDENRYQLELKTLADVGLVGLPNAGKSSLLAAISRAHPKIAAYPFTTLNPHLGVVDFPDFWRMTVADIPGIVPNAHANVGLGLSFLRHIERSRLLLFIVDMSGTNGALPPRTALQVLRNELECYLPGLSGRPAIIAANKMDLPSSPENLAFIQECAGLPVIPICALTGEGIPALTWTIRALLEHLEKREKAGL